MTSGVAPDLAPGPPVAPAASPLICPRCGGENSPDAVFCANPNCRKALGEYPYVTEELDKQKDLPERLAERIAGFIGNPHFVVVHALWFAVWIAANVGLFAFIRRFDEAPFGLLATILAIEVIFITGFLMINDRRQHAHADKRAELDYQVNVCAHRDLRALRAEQAEIRAQLNRLEATVERLAGPPQGPG